MGKGLTTKLVSVCVGGMLLTLPISASANTYSDLVQKKHDVQQQKGKVQSEIDRVNAQLKDLTGQISKTQIEIGQIKAEIDTLNQKIAETKKRMNDRQELLKERVRASYMNGGASVNALEILMGSKNFGDFLNRVVAIYNITDHDQDIIRQQKEDQRLLEKQQAKVRNDLKATQAKLAKLNQLVDQAKDVLTKKQTVLNGLNGQEDEINGDIAKLAAARAQAATGHVQATHDVQAAHPTSAHRASGSSSAEHIETLAYIPKAVANGSFDDLLSAAKRYIGHSKYEMGAMDPVHGVFDCSGFVNWAYQQIGINLGSRSTAGLQYVGRPVSRGELQPGDLVFFNTYKTNGHVGIYIGGNQFIGSQSSTGVEIVSMNQSYWKSRYSMARRVLN
jgi:peptidoglycan hydrolase CwlO-like protein